MLLCVCVPWIERYAVFRADTISISNGLGWPITDIWPIFWADIHLSYLAVANLCMCVWVCPWINVCVSECVSTCLCVFIYICVCVCVCVCVCTCMYVFVCTCVFVSVCADVIVHAHVNHIIILS